MHFNTFLLFFNFVVSKGAAQNFSVGSMLEAKKECKPSVLEVKNQFLNVSYIQSVVV